MLRLTLLLLSFPLLSLAQEIRSLKPVYQAGEHIQVFVDAEILLDGSCGSRVPFWTLQVSDSTGFNTLHSHTGPQMDCGLPFRRFTGETLLLFKTCRSKEEVLLSSYFPSLLIPPGQYRLLLYDRDNAPLPTETFTVIP